MSGRDRVVAVVGATGHTGRFVVAELLRRGFTPVAVGRDRAKLAASGLPVGVTAQVASTADPASLDQGGAVPLRESYELDDAPGFERFFFVTVAQDEPALEVARVMDAARALAASEDAREAALELPEGWRQQSLLLTK